MNHRVRFHFGDQRVGFGDELDHLADAGNIIEYCSAKNRRAKRGSDGRELEFAHVRHPFPTGVYAWQSRHGRGRDET